MYLRKHGVQTVINFDLYEVNGVDLRTDWVPAASDCEIMKDEGSSTECSNTAVDEGSTYSITLTATEMQAARLVLKIVDSATKVFLDRIVIIETYGKAASQHAFDFDSAAVMLASNGLDLIPITEPSGIASDFRETIIQIWRRFYGKSILTSTSLVVYKEDGTTAATTQTLTENAVSQRQGEAT